MQNPLRLTMEFWAVVGLALAPCIPASFFALVSLLFRLLQLWQLLREQSEQPPESHLENWRQLPLRLVQLRRLLRAEPLMASRT